VHAARRLGVLADQPVEAVESLAPGGRPGRGRVAGTPDGRRTGMLLALHGRPWVTACAGARSAADALAAAERLAPDVALVGDPALSRELVAARPGLRTLLLRDDEDCSHAALRDAEATGAVLQRWTSERVADAVRRACRGPRSAGGSCVATGATAPDPVSPRERDVLTALAAGATNPAIARDLGLSPNTVKQHASSIFRKLGVRNRAEAVRRADELGLLAA
jgi:DNA-binding NarL/FixJ family response regulator